MELSHTKREDLIDLIAVFPGVANGACAPDNYRSGFIKNVMIDAKSLRYPSFTGLYSTCKDNPPVKICSQIHNMNPTIIKKFDEFGEADEVFLDSINIQRDIGPNGEEVMRDTG